MKRKAIVWLTILSMLLSGCQLALEEQGSQKRDQLVGVFVTTEHIYHEIHNESNPAAEEERLYAISSGDDYQQRFADIDGYYFYAARFQTDNEFGVYNANNPGISNPSIAFKSTDDGEERTLEATIFFLSGTDLVLYANPVYQTEDGDLYLVQGSGMGISHGRGSINFKENVQTDLEGEESYSISITLNYQEMDQIESVTVIAMDDDNQILEQNTYKPDEVPEQLQPADNTAYYLIQTHTVDRDGNAVVLREIYDREDEWLETYNLNDEGIYTAHSVQIKWE